jgi:outer membrane lipoprotein SlyB
MDYKDFGVIGLAAIGGGIGGSVAGFAGVVGGVFAGSAIGAKWARESDMVRDLRQRVDELEAAQREN